MARAVIGNSPFRVAFLIPGVATVEVDNGIFRIDLDRAIVVAYGPLQIALSSLGHAAVAEGFCEFRIEFDDAVIVGDRSV